MGHDHHHHHGLRDHDAPRNIIIAFWLNTAFAVVEIAGGFYTNSVAILSDAVHDLGDSLSLGLAYYFHRKSKQARDAIYSYGYRRFSLLGAFINSIILIVSCVLIIRESVYRLYAPEQPDAGGMLALACVGLAVNLAALLRLRKGRSVNERVISLHFLEDVLGWIAVLIGSVVMMYADVPVLDPLLSLMISAYILFNVYRNLRTAFRIMLQRVPENVKEKDVRERILAIPGVKDMHDLHFWTMDGSYNVMTLHVVVDAGRTVDERERIKREVKHRLEHLDVHHATVEIESEDMECAQK